MELLSKNTTHFDKYTYSGHGIEFVAHGSFLLSNGSVFGNNVIILGAEEFICAW